MGQLLTSVSKTCSGPSAWRRVVILRVWSLPLNIIQELVRNAPAQTYWFRNPGGGAQRCWAALQVVLTLAAV